MSFLGSPGCPGQTGADPGPEECSEGSRCFLLPAPPTPPAPPGGSRHGPTASREESTHQERQVLIHLFIKYCYYIIIIQ